jgi:hypothetical protein
MNTSLAPRPKRLWFIAILNTAVAVIILVALLFALLSPRVPTDVRPDAYSAVLTACLPLFVIISCVLALLRYRYGRWLALGSAVAFFGMYLTHYLLLLMNSGAVLPPIATRKLNAGVVRSVIEIGLNLWVFLSAKTSKYFAGAPGGP